MEQFGKFILGLVLTVVAIIFNGFVISTLWEWFIVHTFDLPSISIPIAIGVGIILTLMTGAKKSQKEVKTFKDYFYRIIESMTVNAFALFVGWIVFLFL